MDQAESPPTPSSEPSSPDPAPPCPRHAAMAVGIVMRRKRGVTAWVKWVWEPVGLIPGAPPARWKVLREEDGATEYHAATLDLELHRAETEAYRVSLAMDPPSAFIVMRDGEGDGPDGMDLLTVTASAYEAQDYLDSSEDIVHTVALPETLVAWLTSFCAAQAEEAPFVKRRRDRKRIDLVEDGIGDARIRQQADVYRSPAGQKPKRPQ